MNSPQELTALYTRIRTMRFMPNLREFVLTLSCQDSKGIVFAVSGLLFQAGCNILDSQQFGDLADSQAPNASGQFFMRVHFSAPEHLDDGKALQQLFKHTADQFGMSLQFHKLAQKQRVLIMVSKHGHCLNDLLFRVRSEQLNVEIAAVVSNHADYAALVGSYGVAFHHLPLADKKETQEAQIQSLIEQEHIDLVVLARYMQILSPQFCAFLRGRAINIHHSFLPSFKGGRPYYQAHERGVKLIGATAHYVTEDLDEGPIIEQDVERVDHSLSPDDLTNVGRDVESAVLARAVKWHVEHRVLLNGRKTVVFR